jgi:hypothetical protein
MARSACVADTARATVRLALLRAVDRVGALPRAGRAGAGRRRGVSRGPIAMPPPNCHPAGVKTAIQPAIELPFSRTTHCRSAAQALGIELTAPTTKPFVVQATLARDPGQRARSVRNPRSQRARAPLRPRQRPGQKRANPPLVSAASTPQSGFGSGARMRSTGDPCQRLARNSANDSRAGEPPCTWGSGSHSGKSRAFSTSGSRSTPVGRPSIPR